MKVTVRRGHSVHRGVGKGATRKVEVYTQGDDVDLPEDEAKRLIELGAVVVAGSEDAGVAKEAKDTLPADFPGREALSKAGIESYGALATLDKDELIALEGIGEATATKILQALAARK